MISRISKISSRLAVQTNPPRVLAAIAPPRRAPWADYQQRCCLATQSVPPPPPLPPPPPPENAPSRWERMKTLFREHGPVFVVYYGSTWTAGLAVAYGSITVAGLDGLEVKRAPCPEPCCRAPLLSATVMWQLLRWLTVDTYVPAVNSLSPSLINGVIAIELNELADWVSRRPAASLANVDATCPPDSPTMHRCVYHS